MREFVLIHIGQCGINVGSTCWELFCLKHGIQHNGEASTYDESANILFSERNSKIFIESGRFIARSIFVDLDPSIVKKEVWMR